MKTIFEEENKLQRLLEVEAALAKAHSRVGNIPEKDAKVILKRASIRDVKLSRIKEIEDEIHHDLMAVVKALAEVCGDSGRYVHLGATSYDIIDTANALQFKEALNIVHKDLYTLEGILLNLAEKHINTVAVGRTHGQHAVPITYGLKFAIWAREVRRHIDRLKETKRRSLVGKMSGAVGTQASFGKKGMKIQDIVMKELGLATAMVSSQVLQRDRHAELITLLALIASTLDKIGKEIRNLSRTEIAEVSEPFGKKQVGSSTMPHKRNPITVEKICGLARVIKSNVFVALENVSLEHERDLTNSSSERVIFPESFILLDEALKGIKKVLNGLEIYPAKIEENLKLAKGLNMAESIMIALNERGVDRQEAHELLRMLSLKAVREDKLLKEILVSDKIVKKYLNEREIENIIDPHRYIGTAVEQVKEVLEVSKKERKLY